MINCPILTVAGDSVGGNMAIAMVLMSVMRQGPNICKLLLYYPVTNACFDTPSYCQFAVNYYLYRDGMKWFWNQYTNSMEDRNQITASPLRASIDCLKCLPQTMIINGQADVLRSEGEAFGEKLRCAGVDVTALRIQGIIHDNDLIAAYNSADRVRLAEFSVAASEHFLKIAGEEFPLEKMKNRLAAEYKCYLDKGSVSVKLGKLQNAMTVGLEQLRKSSQTVSEMKITARKLYDIADCALRLSTEETLVQRAEQTETSEELPSDEPQLSQAMSL